MIPQVHFIESPIVFRVKRPDWATYFDRITDLSDVWCEECDPENAQGALVTGFYTARTVDALNARHEATDATLFDLDGIAVTTASGTTYHDRVELAGLWGMDTIWRVESVEMEAS